MQIQDARQTDESSDPAAHRAPAVARAASILRLLASDASGLGVSEVARRVGIVPSTCLHVLRALVEEGFVAFDSEKKVYRTGTGLLTLVRDAMANSDFPKVVQPVLDRLAQQAAVTAVAVELDTRDRMVVVALARSDTFISLHVNIGSRFPAYISATGRCVAAVSGLTREELHAKFDSLRWDKAPKFDEWYRDVERVREDKIAIDRGNYVRSLTIVSTLLPIGRDNVIRGLALVGFEHQLTERVLRSLQTDIRMAAQGAAAQLS